MSKLWLEELDQYVVELSKSLVSKKEIPSWNAALGAHQPKRPVRMDNLKLMVETIVACYVDRKLTYGFERTGIPELRMASRQFKQFDYRLIAFTYGSFVKLRYSTAFNRQLESSLNIYLTKDSLIALESFFDAAQKLIDSTPEVGNDELVENRKLLEQEITGIWAQALLEGKIS